ncbi:hypothetical protein E5163_01375 [Marinicauda algicola]|uniref:Uncharacterized protein n=1 Tax=Marinicauda algicola TaxID=2029849 RepID=A0A4V3RYD3_9PROT|nr:hypothetical protein [Marinicauda algicola]TGY89819.1 hypothetical protein E5163_01375 [Marinicauda algicola]
MRSRAFLTGLAAALAAALAVPAATGQTQQELPPELQPQRFDQLRQIDPEMLRQLELNRDQLLRLQETLAQEGTVEDQLERDARGRELRRIDWQRTREDLAVQLQRQSRAGTLTTAPSPLETAPPAMPRNVQADELVRPRLPLLLPETLDAYTHADMSERGMLVFPRDQFYSATYHHDGMMFEVSGSRIVAAEISDPRAIRLWQALRGEDGLTLTRTETGLSASFTRYGAAYDIQVHCVDPDADPRCRDPETIRNVARRLVIAGGSPDGAYLDPEGPR